MSSSNLKIFDEGNGERLSPYRKLPKIIERTKIEVRPPSNKISSSLNVRFRQYSINENRFESINDKQEKFIRIRFYLNDGTKIDKTFRSKEKISDLIEFVRSIDSNLKDQSFYFSTGDVPKRQIQDLNSTIESSKLEDKTVLFIDRY